MELRPTVTADPRTSLVRVWGSSAFLWMSLSWGSTDTWEMKKIISLRIFWVAFQQWLPTCCPSQLSHWNNIPKGRFLWYSLLLKAVATWCSPSPVLSQTRALNWAGAPFLCLHLDPTADTQEPQSHEKNPYPCLSHKKEFLKPPQCSLFVSPALVGSPEETSAPGEKPPIKSRPSNLELLVSHFSVACRTVCWRKSKENYF